MRMTVNRSSRNRHGGDGAVMVMVMAMVIDSDISGVDVWLMG